MLLRVRAVLPVLGGVLQQRGQEVAAAALALWRLVRRAGRLPGAVPLAALLLLLPLLMVLLLRALAQRQLGGLFKDQLGYHAGAGCRRSASPRAAATAPRSAPLLALQHHTPGVQLACR